MPGLTGKAVLMQRPSITFLNRVYPPVSGASGRVLRDLARAFSREGWRVTVITTGPKNIKERDGGIRVIRIKASGRPPKNIFSYGIILLRLALTALRQPADHLIVTLSDPPLSVIAGDIIARTKKCRHIHWCHDLYPDILPALGKKMPGWLMGLLSNWRHRAIARSERTIVVGRCMGKVLSTEGIDPRQITFIPNWPDFELVQSAFVQAISGTGTGSGSALKSDTHPAQDFAKPHENQIKAPDRFRILYAGNIGLAHPMETILQAAEILNKREPF